MPQFVFQARDTQGMRIAGEREAASRQDALQALREAGFFVTKLFPADTKEAQALLADTSTPNSVVPDSFAKEAAAVAPMAAPADENGSRESRPAFDSLRTPAAPRRGETVADNLQIATPLETPLREKVSAPPSTPAPAPVAERPLLPSQAHPPIPPRYDLRSNQKDLALFWSQMHSMLHAGVTVSHAIATMADNAPNRGLRAACGEMKLRLASGKPLSELMLSYPGIFSPLMIGMIRAGEAGGFLDRMCKRLSEYCENDYRIQQTIKRETWYPKLLFVCALMIPTIVPAAVAFFTGNGSFWSTWLRSATPALLTIFAILILIRFKNFLLPLTKHLKPFTMLIDQVKLLVPISGKTTRALATAKFCRALGALQAAGMGVRQTINLSADACGNSVIAEYSRRTIVKLESGASMTEALESTKQFPGIALQMLRTGEATGNFEEQLDKVADFLETDAETAIKQSVTVLGIVAFLMIAIYIAIHVAGMYLGTYTNLIDQGLELQN